MSSSSNDELVRLSMATDTAENGFFEVNMVSMTVARS